MHYCIWFSALKVLAGVLGRREAGRVHCVEAVFRKTAFNMVAGVLGRREAGRVHCVEAVF